LKGTAAALPRIRQRVLSPRGQSPDPLLKERIRELQRKAGQGGAVKEKSPISLEKDFVFASRNLVMYGDLNAAERLFGGELMRWLDEATGQLAALIMGTKEIVTKKFGEVVFDYPGKLGDSVEIWCRVESEGRTSLTLDARVIVRGIGGDMFHQICHSSIVYVALDAEGRPTPWKKRGRKTEQ
jgi:acyl-CoA hydrolase